MQVKPHELASNAVPYGMRYMLSMYLKVPRFVPTVKPFTGWGRVALMCLQLAGGVRDEVTTSLDDLGRPGYRPVRRVRP